MILCIVFLILNVLCASWNVADGNAVLACINAFVAGLLACTIYVGSRA
jgi:hypothetical protein